MTQSIIAIYENGVFKPLESLSLPDKEQVLLTVEVPTKQGAGSASNEISDPLAGVRLATGVVDLAEKFDEYRFGKSN